jgi:L-ascorbate metabolism protein UlaG (beta-lactamase superfamily)
LFVVPLGVGAHLESWGVSAKQIVELDWWAETAVGALTLTATPARHFSGRSMVMADRDATLWAGWAIRGPEHRVYYSGDTAMFPDFAEIGRRLGPFDASLIEVGAYDALWADVHLGPEQAIDAHRLVRGGVLIPVHWGTFDLALHPWTEPVERLLVAASRTRAQVAIPRPGQTVVPAAKFPVARWWPRVPWRTAEIAPVVSTGLN